MSFITKKHLSRRTVLQGLGVTLALPMLESMIPASTVFAQTVAAANRTRFGAIYFPHGVIQANWNPEKEGAGYAITPILEPIKPFYDKVTVVSNLKHALAYGSGATANHNRAASAFLSGAEAKTGRSRTSGSRSTRSSRRSSDRTRRCRHSSWRLKGRASTAAMA